MSEQRIYFLGFLSNVDSSILGVNLNHGFKIKAISLHDGSSLISILSGSPSRIVRGHLYMKFRCLNGSRTSYVIENSFQGIMDEGEWFPEATEFSNKQINGYLIPVLQLMRLFKEGNILLPLYYVYVIENEKARLLMSAESVRYISNDPYRLKNSELPELHRFIQDVKLPFKNPILQLAFENFELSYDISNMAVAFLTLMIGLETLLNRGEHELGYSISRNGAVLLGRDKEDSQNIFSEIRNLYKKRSIIVHTGKWDIVTKEDLLNLRHYVRESIKEIYRMGKSKKEILDLLNSHGFGERRLLESFLEDLK